MTTKPGSQFPYHFKWIKVHKYTQSSCIKCQSVYLYAYPQELEDSGYRLYYSHVGNFVFQMLNEYPKSSEFHKEFTCLKDAEFVWLFDEKDKCPNCHSPLKISYKVNKKKPREIIEMLEGNKELYEGKEKWNHKLLRFLDDKLNREI